MARYGMARSGRVRQGNKEGNTSNSKINLTIKGISPLLMHAYPLMPIDNPPIEKRPPGEQAELGAYRMNGADSELYIPAEALLRCLVGAAVYSKGKGRSSLQKSVAACFNIMPMRLGLGTHTYEIDARRVVIPATRGAVVRYRPRLDNWKVTFELEYDDNLLTEKQARAVVDDAGSRVGLLEFRPEKKGPYGRFMVVK